MRNNMLIRIDMRIEQPNERMSNPVNLNEYEALAQERLPAMVYDSENMN